MGNVISSQWQKKRLIDTPYIRLQRHAKDFAMGKIKNGKNMLRISDFMLITRNLQRVVC
jgi:hypothetical protein